MHPLADADGVLPNEYIGDRVVAAMAVTFSLAVTTLLLRLYCRFRIVRSPGWDDWTAILASTCSLIHLVLNALFLHWGGGHHYIYLSQEQRINARKFGVVAMIPFVFCTAITKISIAFMVIRLATERWMQISMYALIGSAVLVNGVCAIILFTLCRPTYATEYGALYEICRDPGTLQVASMVQGGWSVITDLVCTCTPLVMVWKLRMRLCQKLAVTVLIGFGLVATACCIGRVVDWSHSDFADSTWTGVSTLIWTTCEENIGLLAANLPPLGKLSQVVREKALGSSRFRYFLPRVTEVQEDPSDERVPTIGERPKRSRNSDLELMESGTSSLQSMRSS